MIQFECQNFKNCCGTLGTSWRNTSVPWNSGWESLQQTNHIQQTQNIFPQLYWMQIRGGQPFSKRAKIQHKKSRGPTSLSKPSWRAKIQQNVTLFELFKRKIIAINVSNCLHGPLKKSLRAKSGPRASPWPPLMQIMLFTSSFYTCLSEKI